MESKKLICLKIKVFKRLIIILNFQGRSPGREKMPFKWPATMEECERLSGPCAEFGKIPADVWINKAFWVYPVDLE